jgi:hypothetical protein
MEKLEEKIEREGLKMAQQLIQRHPPYYGQIPEALLRDENKSHLSKLIFGAIHSRAPEKELKNNPVVQISKETLAKDLGVSVDRIRVGINELTEAGWAEKLRQGKMKSNMYVLYPMKKGTFRAIKGIKRVYLRISYDRKLVKRLRESLYK